MENYKGIARACRDAVRKAKARFEMKLARDVKNYKKVFFRYVNNKQKQKDNIGPLLNRRGELVTNNAEKAEVLNTFFIFVFTSTVGPQVLGTKIQVVANTGQSSVKEELVCELLKKLDPYTSMVHNDIHLRVLTELADIVVRPLSIIFEKSWRLGNVP
ncbi:mitochondrial enolase superfamily member 1 [Grus japonensis]|uniref:Mitochondrial enolase superfamily member 1 n=1 Tax=Grus japonensis TaxID=30415 RepID=A0ABC9WKN0_GRUJA